MAREIYKELTREMLKEWGIESINYVPEYGVIDDNSKWYINRYWYKNNGKTKQHIRLKVCNAVCKHKYTTNKSYPIVTFSYKQQRICLPLSRIIYAWFNGKVDQGYVVDHIDNNPYNNHPNNLQLLTQEQNLAKRFADNPDACSNQWDKLKKAKAKVVHECFAEGKSYEETLVEVEKIFGRN